MSRVPSRRRPSLLARGMQRPSPHLGLSMSKRIVQQMGPKVSEGKVEPVLSTDTASSSTLR